MVRGGAEGGFLTLGLSEELRKSPVVVRSDTAVLGREVRLRFVARGTRRGAVCAGGLVVD